MTKSGIHVTIPFYGELHIASLLFDYNGTMAKDGILLAGAAERLEALSELVHIEVITADTFGTTRKNLESLVSSGKVSLITMSSEVEGAVKKLERLRELGIATTCAIGNGRNDRLMLQAAALGIAILGDEGAAFQAIQDAAIVSRNIVDALDLLLHPKRLVATLRG